MRARSGRADSARTAAGVLLVLLVVIGLAVGAVLASGSPGPPVAGTSSSPAAATDLPSPVGSARIATPSGQPAAPATASAPPTSPGPTSSAAPPTAAPSPTASVAPTARPTRSPAPTPNIPQDQTLDASLARCPTADEIALVDSRITMTFIDDPTAPDLVCRAADGSADLTRMEERAYQAVLVMRRIPFGAPLPWTERRMFGWFTRAVSGIRFENVENSYCCFRDREIVIRAAPNMLHLLDNHWAAREEPHWYGLMALPGLLAHEARHAEGYPHTCGNDDETFEEMGAWALHMLWFVWLAEHAPGDYMRPVDAPADLYVEVARDFADDYHSRFCTPYLP